MDSGDIVFLSATELGRNIGAMEISPVEATEAYLRRIEKIEPKLNAFITVTADYAMESARRAESEIVAGVLRSPLHGVPVSVKDQIHTAGMLTTSGSKFGADFIPAEDATAVLNLKRAGRGHNRQDKHGGTRFRRPGVVRFRRNPESLGFVARRGIVEQRIRSGYRRFHVRDFFGRRYGRLHQESVGQMRACWSQAVLGQGQQVRCREGSLVS